MKTWGQVQLQHLPSETLRERERALSKDRIEKLHTLVREHNSDIFNSRIVKQWKLKMNWSAERRGDESELTIRSQRETHLLNKLFI